MEIERWQRLMGEENFVHIHHYCRGLEQTNQALFFERSKQGRDSRLKAALSEFDYVLRNVKADFVMLPEILTRKAQNLLRLDRPELAFPELERALALKADYWPAHAAWSDYYRDAGLPEKAREWLLKGLAAAPGTKALERRLAKLVDTPSKSKAR
jgi:tetratricopeptide (TPR) repeat protein